MARFYTSVVFERYLWRKGFDFNTPRLKCWECWVMQRENTLLCSSRGKRAKTKYFLLQAVCFLLREYFWPLSSSLRTHLPVVGMYVTVFVWHNPTELARSFLCCSCVYFCLYGPFNCILFHKFSWRLCAFQLCSSGLISALLVLSTFYHFMKVSFSPDIIPSCWLGSKHQLTN